MEHITHRAFRTAPHIPAQRVPPPAEKPTRIWLRHAEPRGIGAGGCAATAGDVVEVVGGRSADGGIMFDLREARRLAALLTRAIAVAGG